MKRRGFTLIELLAVIVILAVIALIAVPVVMNVIEKANMSAFKDSAYGIINAGELYYSEQQMSLNGMKEDEVFEFPNNIGTLQLKGELPQGTMVVNKKGQISLAITNGKYCITKDYDDEDIKLLENTSRCAIPYTLAAVATISEELGVTKVDECIKRGTLCNFGPGVEEPTSFAIEVNDTDIYKFYVINDTGEEVTLLMDRNLYGASDSNYGNIPWISGDDYVGNDGCSAIACNDQGPITALNTLEMRTNGWDNILSREYTINDDTGNYNYNIKKNMKARLVKYTEMSFLGCSTTSGSCPAYVYKNLYNTGSTKLWHAGYWTETATSTANAWIVSCNGNFINNYIYNSNNMGVFNAAVIGIRPVITLSK